MVTTKLIPDRHFEGGKNISLGNKITYGEDLASLLKNPNAELETYTATTPVSFVLGSTPPTELVIGTYRALEFDLDAEFVYITFTVPDAWDGVSDMSLKILWGCASGIVDTKTVKWDITALRSISADDTQELDNGAAATGTVTYTQAGVADKNLKLSSIAIDYDHATQPLTAGDWVSATFDRDVTGDTSVEDPAVIKWWVEYTANKMAK